MPLDPVTKRLIRLALEEDLGRAGDLTTRGFIDAGARFSGAVVAKERGVVCGLEAAREVFRLAAPRARFTPLVRDGRAVRPGRAVARVSGPREVLTAERTALNFLQRLSGIATLTRRFVERVRGTRARIYDTRKTAPGWRALEKRAVRCGGGMNHRLGLYDMVMLKDNHLAGAAGSPERRRELRTRVRAFRRSRPRVPVLFEAKTAAEVELALDCGADILLLDNMAPARLKRAIALIRRRSPRAQVEVSGGVTLSMLGRLARLGPDRISIGSLTHSAPALDLSLELRRTDPA